MGNTIWALKQKGEKMKEKEKKKMNTMTKNGR